MIGSTIVRATPGARGIVLIDQVGWRTGGDLIVPENLSLAFLPPCSPELNPIERLWPHLRNNRLSHRVFHRPARSSWPVARPGCSPKPAASNLCSYSRLP
jgi:transposase